jgi:tRNA threonylcarbamoyladenosine biosynthesis protein TsaE
MNRASLTYRASDEAGTRRLGQVLAEVLPEGSVIALVGPLGAGKTRLVQAAAEALGVDRRDVVSPTFVLVHEYAGRIPVIHFDAYRVRDDDEFLQLGAEEYFHPPNVTFIEWADRVAACLPAERLDVTIRTLADEAREFEISSRGETYARIVERLRARLAVTPSATG